MIKTHPPPDKLLTPILKPRKLFELYSLGAVAQLGARLNGIQKVTSSTLVSSTKRNTVLDGETRG
jgi:hypothetical protein